MTRKHASPKSLQSQQKHLKYKSWAQTRQEHLAEIQAFIDAQVFQQHPEYKECIEQVIFTDQALLLWLAFNILQDSEQALDCVMDALDQACRNIQHFSPERLAQSTIRTWLHTIIRNEALDMLEKRQRLKTLSLEQAIEAWGIENSVGGRTSRETTKPSEQPEIALIQQENCNRLAAAFACLPSRQAFAIFAHFLAGQPHSTIAKELGISPKGANMLSSRGTRALRQLLTNEHLHYSDFQLQQFEGLLTQILSSTQDIEKNNHAG